MMKAILISAVMLLFLSVGTSIYINTHNYRVQEITSDSIVNVEITDTTINTDTIVVDTLVVDSIF